jgi:hypothetical protein
MYFLSGSSVPCAMDYETSLLAMHDKLCIGLNVNPNGTDKECPKRYISCIYGPLFHLRRRSNLHLLEIGVRTGASILLWTRYFESANIVGIDNGDDVTWQNQAWVEGGRVSYFKADAYTNSTIDSFANKFDIIIDDGPHSLWSQQWAARHYTNILSPDGLLFIEDIWGGRINCNEIVRSLPEGFSGCVRFFDLRQQTRVGDALVILIHNCHGECNLSLKESNQLAPAARLIMNLRIYEIMDIPKKIFLKIRYEVKTRF